MRRWGVVVLLVLLAALVGWFGGRSGRPDRPERPARVAHQRPMVSAEAAVPPPPSSRQPARTGPFALGINEAVSVPIALLNRGEIDPSRLRSMLADDAAWAKKLGATYVRAHTGAFPRLSQQSLEQHPERLEQEGDVWVNAVVSAGLAPVLMVSPWPGNQTANYTEHYLPTDGEAYEAYVRRIVERYDGDGVDDMPGLKAGATYVEVDNEPDIKFTMPPRDAVRDVPPGSFCKPAEYAEVLVRSARAIRAASPAAKVLGAGLYRPWNAEGLSYWQAVFAQPGAVDAIDVLSIHTYNDDPNAAMLAMSLAQGQSVLPGKAMWVTETSVSLTDGVDGAGQARRLVAAVGAAAIHGASALLWHTLADPPAMPEGPKKRQGATGFRTNSLLTTRADSTRVEKPVGAVFRALSGVLVGHPVDGAVAEGNDAIRLLDGSLLTWGGARPAPAGGIDLTTGATIAPGANATAPAWIAQ